MIRASPLWIHVMSEGIPYNTPYYTIDFSETPQACHESFDAFEGTPL